MADILMLPSAASEPVAQKLYRGGRPKKVIPLWRARLNRGMHKARDHAAAQEDRQNVSHIVLTVSGEGVPNVARWGTYQTDPARASEALHAAIIAFDRQFRISTIGAKSRLQIVR